MSKGLIAQFLVNVTSKGAGKTTKEVDQLADSTNRVGQAQQGANKSANELYNTQDKGVIGTANSTKSFSKLAQTINGGGSSSVVGAYATLAANLFALTAAFNALKGAAAMEQVERGLEALGARTGQTLTVAAKGLKEVTANAINTEQAMRSAAQVFSAGFDSKDLERIGKVANDASFALGRSMTDSMDRLTRGVIKLEPELLDELGIMTRLGEATKAYASQMGKTESALTTAEKRQAFFNSVMAEGELKFGGLADAAGNTRAFDVLQATLSDMSKSGLTLLNKVLMPLASMFSMSPLALGGAAVLFAGAIKSQLLPGLSNLTDNALAAAKAMQEVANQEIKDVLDLGTTDKLDPFIGKLKAGTVATEDFRNAQKILKAEIKNNLDDITTLQTDSKPTALNTQYIAVLRDEIRSLSDDLIEVNQAAAAYNRVQYSSAAANAIQSASTFKMRDALNHLRTAQKFYTVELLASQVAQQSSLTLMNRMRLASFSAAIGVRALGAAFLNAIPVIGQILFVLGLVVAGFKALESESSKRVKAALKDLTTTVSALSDKMAELERINASTASAASKAEAALRLESNTVLDLAAAYDKLVAARDRKDKKQTLNEDLQWWEKTITGLNPEDLMVLGNKGISEISYSFSTLNKEALQLYNSLKVLDPTGLEKMVKATDNFSKLSAKDQIALMAPRLKAMAKEAAVVSTELEAITNSQKGVNDAMSKFLKDSAITTEFDAVVSSMHAMNLALQDSTILADKSKASYEQLATVASNIPSAMRGLLSVNANQALKDAEEISRLGGKDTRNQVEESLLEAAKARQAVSTVTVQSLMAETAQIQKQFELAQRSVILAKSENALLQSKLRANQDNYAITANGVQRQLEAENKIIENNVKGLQISKAMLAQNLANLDADMARTREAEKKNAQDRENLILQKEAAKVAIETDIAANIASRDRYDSQTEPYKKYDKLVREGLDWHLTKQKEITALIEASSSDQVRIEQATKERARERAALALNILSVQNQINAELAGMNSLELIAAKRREKQVEIDRARLGTIRSIRSVFQETTELQTRINSLSASGRVSMADELGMQRAKFKLSRETQNSQYQEGLKNLEVLEATAKARGTDERDRQDIIKHIAQERQLLEANNQVNLAKLDTEQRLYELNVAIFDTQKQGLDWQKDSLSLLERQITASSELYQNTKKREDAERRLTERRRGYKEDKTAAGERADEIREATMSFKLVRDGAQIKKTMIDLEFALLEAQQVALRDELRTRMIMLRSMNDNGKFDTHIAQLEATIGNISNINFSAISRMSKDAVDQSIASARTTLEAALTNSSQRINRASFDYLDKRAAEAEARAQLNSPEAAARTMAPVLGASIAENVEEKLRGTADSNSVLATSMDSLKTAIDALSSLISKESSAAVAAMSNQTPQQIAAAVGAYLNTQGFRADEQSSLGGVTAGAHRGRGHAEDRAFDLNIGRGNTEWENPAQKARFDKLAADLREAGATVIWGTKGHFDHMHVEFKEGMTNMTKVMELIGRTLPVNVGRAVSEEVATVLPDVVVNASRGFSEVLEQFAPKILSDLNTSMPSVMPTMGYGEAGIESMKMFEEQAASLMSIFEQLGPEGEVMNSAVRGVTQFGLSLETALNSLKNEGDVRLKFVAISDTVGTALSAIQQMASASAEARVGAIDREIAAEQKRDGKSVESVAKISALEKKKDAMQRKAFETNKKLQLAQSVIATASGMAQALTLGPIIGPVMAAMIGALGAAQVAVIAGTSYQSTAAGANSAMNTASTLAIGKRGDTVDLAKNNPNAGGELGYLRGSRGQGNNASNYSVIGSAYGGPLPRGYGNSSFLVGENGPEVITPEVPVTVQPAGEGGDTTPIQANFNITAFDGQSVQDMLMDQRGYIIRSLREAANANGQTFLENVNVSVYTKPNIGKL